jgi:hypothetical protein
VKAAAARLAEHAERGLARMSELAGEGISLLATEPERRTR